MHSSTLIATFAFLFVPLVLADVQQINVAAMFSLTYQGSPDTAGVSRQTGFIAAVQDINANPRYNTVLNFSATYYDTQRVPQLAANETQRALDAGSIAVVTVVTTPETQAIMNVSGTVPNVCAGANAASFSSPSAYPYFVRDIPSGSDQTSCMAAIINQMGTGLTSATVYTANDAATAPIANALLSKITSPSLPVLSGIPAPNASDAVSFLEGSGARIWPIVCQANDISVIFSAIAASTPTVPYIVPSVDSALTSSLFSAPNSETIAQNLFACTLSAANTSAYQTFLASYNRVAPTNGAANITMDSKAPYTYDLAFIIAEAALAVINAGTDVSDNQVLMNAIRQVNFTGASGQIFFNADSNDIAEKKTYIVKRVVGSNFEQVGIYGADGVFDKTDNSFVFPPAPTTTGSTNTTTGPTLTSTTTSNPSTSSTSSSSTDSSSTTTSSASSLFISFSSLLLLLVAAIL